MRPWMARPQNVPITLLRSRPCTSPLARRVRPLSCSLARILTSKVPKPFSVSLSNPVGGTLGSPATATVQITDDVSEPATNAIDDSSIFVGQHYHDFLARQAEQGGQDFWTNKITVCGGDATCIQRQRIGVSAQFFIELEFQQTGFYLYRAYKAALGAADLCRVHHRPQPPAGQPQPWS